MKIHHSLEDYKDGVRNHIQDAFAFQLGTPTHDLIAEHIRNGTIEDLVDTTARQRKAEDDANGGLEEGFIPGRE